MSLGLCILMILFVALLCINVPIAFILGIVTVAAAFSLGYEQVLVTIASDMASGIDSFTLLAIPFFIFSGDLMGAGGLAKRLIDFANSLVGRFRGGLGLVNTLTCVFSVRYPAPQPQPCLLSGNFDSRDEQQGLWQRF